MASRRSHPARFAGGPIKDSKDSPSLREPPSTRGPIKDRQWIAVHAIHTQGGGLELDWNSSPKTAPVTPAMSTNTSTSNPRQGLERNQSEVLRSRYQRAYVAGVAGLYLVAYNALQGLGWLLGLVLCVWSLRTATFTHAYANSHKIISMWRGPFPLNGCHA